MFSSGIGIFHFATSVLAIVTGTAVLAGVKGSERHRLIGYVYAAAMLCVLVTSFLLYNLHGSFGVLHWMAVVSSLTLVSGLIPLWIKRPASYMAFHFSFMYWSVIGLYCAFIAEVFTRIPFMFDLGENLMAAFYGMVGLGTGLGGMVGMIYFRKYKDKWNARYNLPRQISDS